MNTTTLHHDESEASLTALLDYELPNGLRLRNASVEELRAASEVYSRAAELYWRAALYATALLVHREGGADQQ